MGSRQKSSPKEAIKQHYIPKFIIKNFCDKDGYIHYIDKTSSSVCCKRSYPKFIFSGDRIYDIETASVELKQKSEKTLSHQESISAPIIRNIICSVREGITPNLCPKSMSALSLFFVVQWGRTPESRRQMINPDQENEIFEDALIETIRTLGLDHEQAENVRRSIDTERLLRNARNENVVSGRHKVAEMIFDRGISILKARPKKSFLIGSNPIVKLTPPETGDISDKRVEVWFPIAADLAMGLGDRRGAITVINNVADNIIRAINICIARQISIIGGRDAALVKSIAREVYGIR